jgi:hypothetical protein
LEDKVSVLDDMDVVTLVRREEEEGVTLSVGFEFRA